MNSTNFEKKNKKFWRRTRVWSQGQFSTAFLVDHSFPSFVDKKKLFAFFYENQKIGQRKSKNEQEFELNKYNKTGRKHLKAR